MCQNRGEEEQREVSHPSWLHTVEHVYLIFLSLSCLASNGWQMCWCLGNLCGLLHKFFFSRIHFYANIYLQYLKAWSLKQKDWLKNSYARIYSILFRGIAVSGKVQARASSIKNCFGTCSSPYWKRKNFYWLLWWKVQKKFQMSFSLYLPWSLWITN